MKRYTLFVLAIFMLIPAYAQYITGKVIAYDDYGQVYAVR